MTKRTLTPQETVAILRKLREARLLRLERERELERSWLRQSLHRSKMQARFGAIVNSS